MAPLSSLLSLMVAVFATGLVHAASYRKGAEECTIATDIVFVLDESGSIYGLDFKLQLEFVNDYIDRFNTAPNYTHVGIMTFSDLPETHMMLGEMSDKSLMKGLVSNIPQRRGQTMTHIALDHMTSRMFARSHARSWVPQIAIIITDGNPDYKESTAEAAKRAHEAGIAIIAIGVGRQVDRDVLVSIASRSDLVFSIDNYAGLDAILDRMTEKTCHGTTLPPTTTTTTIPTTLPLMIHGCKGHSRLDIAFALPDDTGVIDTEYSLDFVDNMVSEFELGASQVHVALTPRYCDGKRGVMLKEYDIPDAFSAALFVRRRLHSAPIHRHLDHLIKETYKPANGARDGATKVAILMVDNQAEEELVDLVAAAKEMEIHFIVIGVGGHVVESELGMIASSPDDVLRVGSYSELASISAALRERLCAVASGISLV